MAPTKETKVTKAKGKAAAKTETKTKKAVAKATKAAPAKKAEPKVEAKGQKKRVKKDKDAPKKPMPPFFCYQKLRRDILKGEKPTADNTQLIKIMSEEWRGLTDE